MRGLFRAAAGNRLHFSLKRTLLHFCLALSLSGLYSCTRPRDSGAAKTEPDSDEAYLTFGKIFPAEKPSDFDPTNPHRVAQYSLYLCKQGRTQDLAKELPQVESDPALGRAFRTLIAEFGKDLERFNNVPMELEFTGYYTDDRPGHPTTVWYYYLKDKNGAYVLNKSWISVHRSIQSKRCALTGIFLNTPDQKPAAIPEIARRK